MTPANRFLGRQIVEPEPLPDLSRRAVLAGLAASLFAGRAEAQQEPDRIITPAWLERDLRRKAEWLPEPIKRDGLAATYRRRMLKLPENVQKILRDQNIPPWLIALIPMGEPQPGETPKQKYDREKQQFDIVYQLGIIDSLAGEPPANKHAARVEQLMEFAGAAQIPALGDKRTGKSLRDAGCSALFSRVVFDELRRDFPDDFSGVDERLFDSQEWTEIFGILQKEKNSIPISVRSVPFEVFTREMVRPGDIIVKGKTEGLHGIDFVRAPVQDKYEPGTLIGNGNSGRKEIAVADLGHVVKGQEYLVARDSHEGLHNLHGPITNRTACVDLTDPATNPYFCYQGDIIIISFGASLSQPAFGTSLRQWGAPAPNVPMPP